MPERISTPESAPSLPPSPERAPIPESSDSDHEAPRQPHPEEGAHEASLQTPVSHPTVPKPMPDPIQKEVELILSEGLEDAYAAMDPLSKKEFKEEGEHAATEIRSLLAEARMKIHKVLKILTDWLRMIPGVSRLFVEQEAKIKTDRLLALRNKGRTEPPLP